MRLATTTVILGLLLAGGAGAQQGGTADLTLADVAERLARPSVLRGRFSQTRRIPLLSRPLESSGQFILSEIGLYWRQERPFPSTLVANGEQLVQRVGDSSAAGENIAEQIMAVPFSRIFLGLFRGDEDALAEHFSSAFSSSEVGWEIQLTPIGFPLSEAIDRIVVRGQEHIEQLDVLSKSADEMSISFHDLETHPEYLTDDEIGLYAW